jgi:uncharacterized UBP type Zn finger protein
LLLEWEGKKDYIIPGEEKEEKNLYENILKENMELEYTGIKNEGANCFMSSVIQVLFFNLEF